MLKSNKISQKSIDNFQELAIRILVQKGIDKLSGKRKLYPHDFPTLTTITTSVVGSPATIFGSGGLINKTQ